MKFKILAASSLAILALSMAIPVSAACVSPQTAAALVPLEQNAYLVISPAPEVAAIPDSLVTGRNFDAQQIATGLAITDAIKIDGQIASANIAASPPPEHINASNNSITATHVTPALAASLETQAMTTAPPPPCFSSADFGASNNDAFATASAAQTGFGGSS